MKVCFIHNHTDREIELANAFCEGVERGGDSAEVAVKSSVLETEASVVCMVGVKSLKLFRQARDAGKHVVYFDKGYFRHRGPGRTWEYWRVAVDDHHPVDYLGQARHSPDRWDIIAQRRDVSFPGWRTDGNHIVYAGSSAKYHAFAGLKPPTEYGARLLKDLKKRTNRLLVYRPKPSWGDAVPIEGSSYSGPSESIEDVLKNAWTLVTAGSNACFDAVLNGIPTIVLGNGIAKPISSTSLDDIENPYLASDQEVMQWLSNIAWCMFTEREMRLGLAWEVAKAQIQGRRVREGNLPVIAAESMKTPAVLKRERYEARQKLRKSKSSKKRLKRKRLKRR